MEFTLLDRSNYFRGLLLLAAKDKKLCENEISIIKTVGSKLGFEKSFYEESIKNLLDNEHIPLEPPRFSNQNVSEKFILDGIKLALSDTNLDPDELKWLREVADYNGISKDWFAEKLKYVIENNQYTEPLEILSLN